MKFLFVHQNFPGQFINIVDALASDASNQVVAIGADTARTMIGVDLQRYSLALQDVTATHVFARRFDIECRRAEQVLYVATALLSSGFYPDLIFAHCGWGEALPLRATFPNASLVAYCEYYYNDSGGDVGFDPREPVLSIDARVSLRAKNAASLLALAECDLAISPTHWQRSTYPAQFHSRIRVCHEGIDTNLVRPDPNAVLSLAAGLEFRAGDEILTFVARNLEPIRGYLELMRALPLLLRERPKLHVLIVGGDGVSYGSHPSEAQSWKDVGVQLTGEMELERVHFLGRLPYHEYLRVLQVSAVHAYLSFPFVLSWSLLEAMASSCIVLASDTEPCREVIDVDSGFFVDPFDTVGLAAKLSELIERRSELRSVRVAAREIVVRRFSKDKAVSSMRALLASL